MRRPGVVVGTAFITVLALLVALGLILFSVNPGVNRNEGEIKEAVMSQHAIICAQVQNTANAYRFRSLTPSGEVEPIRHFLTRMEAQAQTLRLASGAECKSAPGFPPVGIQIRRALAQIKRIVDSLQPRLRHRASSRGVSSSGLKDSGFPSSLSGLSNARVEESGVPATLKPGLAPSAPLGAQKGPSGQSPGPTPPAQAQPVLTSPEAPVPPASEAAGEEGGTRVVEAHPELPVVPLPPIEIKLQLP